MPEIKPPPSLFMSKVWTHFGCFALKEKAELDMLKAICKLCNTHVAYCGNTTNLTAHLTRQDPEVNAELVANLCAAASQQTLKAVLYKLLSSSEKAKRITKSIADFICKDLWPHCVVENKGFRNMLHTLESRYVIPSKKYFSEAAVPQIYKDIKEKSKKISAEQNVLLSPATHGLHRQPSLISP